MTTTNYSDLRVGCMEKKAVITNFETRVPRGRRKLYLKLCPTNGSEITVNEVWYEDTNKGLVTQGLWLDTDADGQLYPTSLLARLLTSMGLSTIGDLIGKTVLLRPKPNGFLCIVMK